jgi:hypothetical protein
MFTTDLLNEVAKLNSRQNNYHHNHYNKYGISHICSQLKIQVGIKCKEVKWCEM